MKPNEKKMILTIIVIGIIIISLIAMFGKNRKPNVPTNQNYSTDNGEQIVEVLNSGTKLNVSEKLSETKYFGNYEVTNIQLREKDGKTQLNADLKNIGDSKLGFTSVDIEFKDKAGNKIGMVKDVLIGETEVGNTTKLKAETSLNCVEAYDFSISINE